jgi:hypothetical protein
MKIITAMIQMFMPNEVMSELEDVEDFPGGVDAIEAVYKDTSSSAEAPHRRPKGCRHFRSVCGVIERG